MQVIFAIIHTIYDDEYMALELYHHKVILLIQTDFTCFPQVYMM